jgi:hypothetical protein
VSVWPNWDIELTRGEGKGQRKNRSFTGLFDGPFIREGGLAMGKIGSVLERFFMGSQSSAGIGSMLLPKTILRFSVSFPVDNP